MTKQCCQQCKLKLQALYKNRAVDKKLFDRNWRIYNKQQLSLLVELQNYHKKQIQESLITMSQDNEDDPYDLVIREKIKLKSDDTIFSKKKSKKKKSKKFADSVKVMKTEEPVEEEKSTVIYRTKAQMAFEKQREKLQQERIKEKATKTHKQRVEEFNKHLDSLTEHFDIPKVSWTK